ncbi:MAG: hypothetical protein HJJLKODD_02429 [Phycisphaerae bacterium]|nr:hypothetical protein [Phycisphaerae bacterium]
MFSKLFYDMRHASKKQIEPPQIKFIRYFKTTGNNVIFRTR